MVSGLNRIRTLNTKNVLKNLRVNQEPESMQRSSAQPKCSTTDEDNFTSRTGTGLDIEICQSDIQSEVAFYIGPHLERPGEI